MPKSAKKNLPAVLITGGAKRIGASITRLLHANQMNVIIHYHLSEKEAHALAHELNQVRPHSAFTIAADLSEMNAVNALAERASQFFGRLDVLVNNAARFYKTHFGQISDFAWEDLMSSNLKAPFFLAQACMPALKASQQGLIVNIADIHGLKPIQDYSVYCLTKHAIYMLTRILAKELAPEIRVNGVAPGPVLWPEGTNVLSEDDKQMIIARTALGRGGSPEDIAKAVLFFIQDAPFITGQILNVDGGRSLSY